mmetsp:Transcript_17589/g.27398  ORF Transcript_17589/g.27398 Transcript_17589/m.27398 type:complete len:216 (-) Transcript_17589:224-871(-)
MDSSYAQFDRYDEEFNTLTEQVQGFINVSDVESQGKDLKMGSNLLSQCDDLLKQMSMEARGVNDSTVKRELLNKVRVCKARLANLRDDYNNAKQEAEREALIDSSQSGLDSDHRARLLSTNERIGAQNDTLDHARRVMAETEDVALEITTELGRNREKIESAHGRVFEVSGMTNQARRLIMNMSRREVQQKLAIYVVAMLLLGAVLFIIYYSHRK